MKDEKIEENLTEEIEFLQEKFKELKEKDEPNEKEIRLLSKQINDTIKLRNSFKLKDSTTISSWITPFMGTILSKLPFKDQISLISTFIEAPNEELIRNIELSDLKPFIQRFEKVIKELTLELERREEQP